MIVPLRDAATLLPDVASILHDVNRILHDVSNFVRMVNGARWMMANCRNRRRSRCKPA
jgi:hypothetical protein